MDRVLQQLDPQSEKSLPFLKRLLLRKNWNYIGLVFTAFFGFLALVIGRNENSFLAAGFCGNPTLSARI